MLVALFPLRHYHHISIRSVSSQGKNSKEKPLTKDCIKGILYLSKNSERSLTLQRQHKTGPKGLNDRQRKFALAYAENGKGLEAYKTAGYSWADEQGRTKKSAIVCASKLAKNPKVAREIDRLRAEKTANAPGQGSHTVEYVRSEHLRQYNSLQGRFHGEAFKHLQALGQSLGAYQAASSVHLHLHEVDRQTRQAALQIASVLTLGIIDSPESHEDTSGSTNAALPVLSIGDDGELAPIDVEAIEVQEGPVITIEEGPNPPRPRPRSCKLPPPTCISNLGSPYCFGTQDDI